MREDRTATRIGVYPDLYDIEGQYPPLYAVPTAADYFTYLYMKYGDKGVPFEKPGFTKFTPGRMIERPGSLPPP